jgi:hypothetical protein
VPSQRALRLAEPGRGPQGQVLAGSELRREEDGALPRSLSGPVYRRQTAAATAFADRHAPLLASQADIAPPPAAPGSQT